MQLKPATPAQAAMAFVIRAAYEKNRRDPKSSAITLWVTRVLMRIALRRDSVARWLYRRSVVPARHV